MSRRANVEQTLDLPPGYTLVALRELGDAFAHGCVIAAEAGAGTLVWVRRYDLVEFAVVLEPEEPLQSARRAFFAGMNAAADAIAAHCPPEREVGFDWPDVRGSLDKVREEVAEVTAEIEAARRIPLSAMGFLQFITPTMTFVLGLKQGEPFTPARAASFALIWTGAAVFLFGAWRRTRNVRLAARASH